MFASASGSGCETDGLITLHMTNIALVPGVLGFRRIGSIHYFNGVAPHLEQTFPGLMVREMTTDPLGTVADRTRVLALEIVKAFGPAEPVHLIAHSMGGLDSRFLVAKNVSGVGSRVKTVVSIGTPHLGSPVASLLQRANLLDRFFDFFHIRGGLLAELRAKVNAAHDLSEEGAAELDRLCPDDPGVRYLEIAGTGREGTSRTSAFFAPMYRFLNDRVGPNDGMVPLTSAERGRKLFGTWAADHADLIGHDLDRPLRKPTFDHLRAYEDVVRRAVLQ